MTKSAPPLSNPAAASQPAALARDPARAGRAGNVAGGGRVSPAIARIEPWVSWSLAAYTAWIALISFPDVPSLWLFVLYAGVLGKWCDLYPSRRQGRLFTHGALLVFAAYFLHAHTSERLGGAGGLFFFWVAIPALAYAFMLRPRWAVAIASLSALEFLVASGVTGTLGVSAVAQCGFLLLFPLALTMPFGEAMRKPDRLLEQSRVDSSTGLLNRDGLLSHGDELLHACRREKRPATVAVFGCEDLIELREMYGRKVARKALDMLVEKFQAIAGSRGLVARTGAAEFSLMLPGLNREKAINAIARQLGNPLRLEFDMAGEEIVMTPMLVIEVARTNEASIEALHTELRTDLHSLLAASRQEDAVMRASRNRPYFGDSGADSRASEPPVDAAVHATPYAAPAPVRPSLPVALGAR